MGLSCTWSSLSLRFFQLSLEWDVPLNMIWWSSTAASVAVPCTRVWVKFYITGLRNRPNRIKKQGSRPESACQGPNHEDACQALLDPCPVPSYMTTCSSGLTGCWAVWFCPPNQLFTGIVLEGQLEGAGRPSTWRLCWPRVFQFSPLLGRGGSPVSLRSWACTCLSSWEKGKGLSASQPLAQAMQVH